MLTNRGNEMRRAARTVLIGSAVVVFLVAALVLGYHLHHAHQVPVVRERRASATVGADAAGAQPPPVADASTPGVALAAGGVDLGNPSVVADGSGFALFTTQATPLLHVPVVSAAGGSWGHGGRRPPHVGEGRSWR